MECLLMVVYKSRLNDFIKNWTCIQWDYYNYDGNYENSRSSIAYCYSSSNYWSYF